MSTATEVTTTSDFQTIDERELPNTTGGYIVHHDGPQPPYGYTPPRFGTQPTFGHPPMRFAPPPYYGRPNPWGWGNFRQPEWNRFGGWGQNPFWR